MRWLNRGLRFLVLGISFSALYLFCVLQPAPRQALAVDQEQPLTFLDTNGIVQPTTVRVSPSAANQLLDIEDFRFVKNCSHVCAAQGSDPYLLAFVHSAPSNFNKRNVIRETWASPKTLLRLNVKVVFIIGLSNDSSIEALLDKEHARHADLVQGNFVDTYKNLTYKHLAGFKWVMNFCNRTSFVMKADDDAFVDIFRAVELLREAFDLRRPLRPAGVVACSVFPDGTLAKRDGKWALTLEEYASDKYPTYCSGIVYFLTPDMLAQLYSTAHRLEQRFIWIDDLFVTGIVASEAGVRHHALNLKFAYDPKRLRAWLDSKDLRPCPYVVGDIGETHDWERLMFKLWEKTARVWR